jgi:hypothetical protein
MIVDWETSHITTTYNASNYTELLIIIPSSLQP